MTAADPRHDQRRAFVRAYASSAEAALVPASSDAGSRSYWRLASQPSTIVMDAPPASDDLRPWLAIRDLLEQGGVRVPKVLARDVEQGFLLLEDLGSETLLQVMDEHNADAHVDAAISQLLRIQSIKPPPNLPACNEAFLLRELELFDQWFVDRHLGIALSCDDFDRLELGYRRLINAALVQPQVLMHRDFMPRNLMPVDDGPAVLDFQDAVRGPIAYDPISLFKDAFISWPQSRVDDWLDGYHARALHAGLPLPPLARFRRDADFIGVQRHLKVLGVFARLNYRDGKPAYLADAARFMAYLDAVLPRYADLASLDELMQVTIKPAFARSQAAHA